jgi:hypothetical protein
MALSENSKFWASRIGVMAAVMAAAIGFLFYAPEPGLDALAGGEAEQKANISESVSRFYAEFRQSSPDPIKERFGEYTILLEGQNDKPIENLIKQLRVPKTEPSENWEGDVKERAFAATSTLMTEAKAHAVKDGYNLVWDLEQDFTIMHRYQSTTSLVGMLEEIAGAVDSNFIAPIFVYYCRNKRALVITVRNTDYLVNNCQTNHLDS